MPAVPGDLFAEIGSLPARDRFKETWGARRRASTGSSGPREADLDRCTV
ncbi:hypothetical protein [Actinomyces israelii]|nr:hypothetical protein [Actinomyces israelii]